MINDVKVERIDEGAHDPLGAPFTTWHTAGNSASLFDDAVDRHDVKLIFLRSMSSPRPGEWAVRFSAYDVDGNCITSKVCGAVTQ